MFYYNPKRLRFSGCVQYSSRLVVVVNKRVVTDVCSTQSGLCRGGGQEKVMMVSDV